jgi:hypothetical protein
VFHIKGMYYIKRHPLLAQPSPQAHPRRSHRSRNAPVRQRPSHPFHKMRHAPPHSQTSHSPRDREMLKAAPPDIHS